MNRIVVGIGEITGKQIIEPDKDTAYLSDAEISVLPQERVVSLELQPVPGFQGNLLYTCRVTVSITEARQADLLQRFRVVLEPVNPNYADIVAHPLGVGNIVPLNLPEDRYPEVDALEEQGLI